MKIFEVKERTQELVNTLLEVWENSVKATHLFLSDNEIEKIKEYVPQALKEVAHLIVIENENDIPIAFMGIEGTKLEMLFIKNSEKCDYNRQAKTLQKCKVSFVISMI